MDHARNRSGDRTETREILEQAEPLLDSILGKAADAAYEDDHQILLDLRLAIAPLRGQLWSRLTAYALVQALVPKLFPIQDGDEVSDMSDHISRVMLSSRKTNQRLQTLWKYLNES